MRYILDLIMDILAWIYGQAKTLVLAIVEKFLEINIFEKLIVVATLLAFAAVVAPVGKYVIFDAVFKINNPIAHYMIGITLVMIATVYVPGILSMIARVSLNLSYLVYIVYLHSAGEISKAPYEVASGYYFNIAAPIVYAMCAVASVLIYRDSTG